ncbi:MAG: ice-binding family protein [Solirubrobacteraceae bacterium]
MSNLAPFERVKRSAAVLAFVCAFVAIPAAAQASQINLATASPFVVLGGQAVSNTGPSVLNGDLGVAPGTALTGFGSPAVVNGATHDNDGVAKQAQSDLTNAYNVAAGQPLTADLSGTDLGNRTLTAGAYKFTSSAQLTGPLTLDGQGDPNAQFVFQIASTLTTASASSVLLINQASPCNVYWQIGSSATLGTTTSFQGNLMALTSISLNDGATVRGRMLARNGAVTLINNVLDGSRCGTGLPRVLPPVLLQSAVPATAMSPAISQSKLTLVKRANRPSVQAGRNVSYNLTVKNTSATIANHVVVTDTIPAGMQFVSASRKGSFTGNKVSFNVGNIAPGKTVTIRITLRADLNAHGNTTNRGSANADNAPRVTAGRRVRVTRPPVVASKRPPPLTG